jgi:radical SAM superfamily enzyme YgiQ (UPF0313 family)
MMKLLLISPNIEYLPDPIFPLGLAYIAAALKRRGVEYQILDLCFVEDIAAELADRFASYQPDLVGLSLRNLDNVSYPNYTSYLPFYKEVVDNIRRLTDSRILLGGSAFSLMPREIFTYLDADFGIVGEGESAIIRLLDQIDMEKQTGRRLEKCIIRDCEVGVIQKLDEYPAPERSGIDSAAYLKLGGMGNLQTKRGCPFNCIYCTYPIIEGQHVRLRSPRHICDEIESLIELGIENVFIVDNEFNFPVEHAQFVCHEIIRRKLKIKWSGYANPKFIQPRLVSLMQDSGCTGIEFGSDAANAYMLKNMGKAFSLEEIKRASRICHQSDLSFCHSLLIGGPGETMRTVQQTFDAILDMAPTAVVCMVGIRVFPGTRLSDIARKEGILREDQDLLKPFFYLSPAIQDTILPFVQRFSEKHPTWIFPGMGINIDRALQKKIRRLGARGPLWEYMRMGRRFKS